MSELRTLDGNIIANLVINGDLKGLNDKQRVEYYNYRCNQIGLDPSAKPFDLISFQGKLVLYANAACTQQLTNIHKLSHRITFKELVDDVYCVGCQVTGPDGRTTENMAGVPLAGLKGEAKANAFMKATTKAIRRTVLAHCGLGMLDETEVQTIPDAKRVEMPELPVKIPWAEEDCASADCAIGAVMDALLEKGFSHDDAARICANCRKLFDEKSISYQEWCNRYYAFTEIACKKYDLKL